MKKNFISDSENRRTIVNSNGLTIISDSENRRTIVKNWDGKSLTIKGDLVPSALSVYCVISRTSGRLYSLSLTSRCANERCLFYNKHFPSNDSFEVVKRYMFV